MLHEATHLKVQVIRKWEKAQGDQCSTVHVSRHDTVRIFILQYKLVYCWVGYKCTCRMQDVEWACSTRLLTWMQLLLKEQAWYFSDWDKHLSHLAQVSSDFTCFRKRLKSQGKHFKKRNQFHNLSCGEVLKTAIQAHRTIWQRCRDICF